MSTNNPPISVTAEQFMQFDFCEPVTMGSGQATGPSATDQPRYDPYASLSRVSRAVVGVHPGQLPQYRPNPGPEKPPIRQKTSSRSKDMEQRRGATMCGEL
jgi:hypothetical protein